MLKIHNTLSRRKEAFTPLKNNTVRFYACGVTVYDHCHIGHARTFTSVDVMVRYLKFKGYEVVYVRNITDIDDKIIKRASETNEPCEVLTERFIQSMNEDFTALGLSQPSYEPRATQYIQQMISLIEKIMAKQHAYVGGNGDVYFDVKSFPAYGRLSHHTLEKLESGARVEVSSAKRDPLDFVLWKLAKPGEPKWDSPWGAGRPGWHIECSAMAIDLLGTQFDLHAGARDLIFPHHENELAQSQAATDEKFVNCWMHGGFLQIDKEKMSKSLGNFVTIKDVLKEQNPEILRYILISSHYRSPLVYSSEMLLQAKQSLNRFYTSMRFLPPATAISNTSYEAQFIQAMDDDFNTPIALSVLFDLAHEIQRLRDKDMTLAAEYAALLKKLGQVLGIISRDPEAYFRGGGDKNEDKIQSLIQARESARQAKNWSEADRIRNELADMGILIEDSAQGTTWKFK